MNLFSFLLLLRAGGAPDDSAGTIKQVASSARVFQISWVALPCVPLKMQIEVDYLDGLAQLVCGACAMASPRNWQSTCCACGAKLLAD